MEHSSQQPKQPNQPHPIIQLTDKGLYCAYGDFYIDPWQPVERAVITHGHADHARPGSQLYFCHRLCEPIIRKRLGEHIHVSKLEYGETTEFKSGSYSALVSLHSAGHILGSSQIRVEVNGEVWVASGDYKRDDDPSCDPFEVVPCDTFITEATFAMPIYRWPKTSVVAGQVYEWWQENAQNGLPSILFCYALGKSQRLLAELSAYTDQTVLLHGAVDTVTDIYRAAGIAMVPTKPALVKELVPGVQAQGDKSSKSSRLNRDFSKSLVIAPPSARGSAWMKRFGKCSTGFCSGWMAIRGARRRQSYDRGFVISDHADWHSLLKTIKETGATKVLATHGQSDLLVRYLNQTGVDAMALSRQNNVHA